MSANILNTRRGHEMRRAGLCGTVPACQLVLRALSYLSHVRKPKPKGKRGFLRRSSSRICCMSHGQEKLSLPLALHRPKSTSATPPPSVPGSHAESSASMLSITSSGMTRGLPQTSTTTTARPCALSVRTRSASGMCKSEESPPPSTYGRSPVHMSAVAPCPLMAPLASASSSSACSTNRAAGHASRTPSHNVVPIVAAFPVKPFHPIDQPPHCMPRS
mmetsp:Transcript_577/g.1253  ORF Transcript_577/g.1253 Transcript_577/m.1253 type:complete len:218 (+) Transcript_577:68-721(+)